MPSGGPATAEGTELFDGKVQITADVPTNALVIIASPSDYMALMPVIQKLDIRRPQAFVEAMILEVNIDKALNLGTAAHLGKQFQNGKALLFGGAEFSNVSSLSLLGSTTAVPEGLTTGVQGRTISIPVPGASPISIPIYGATFRALQTNGTINVLSTPTILTSDNKEAEIEVGQTVPFLTSSTLTTSGQPFSTVSRESVSLKLTVTPSR